MAFRVTPKTVSVGGVAGTALEMGNDTIRAEVWPSHGFNCLRWQTRVKDGWDNLLYTAPDWDTNPVPTRSGHPILFPFPNRLKHGRFSFAGREYQLPLNETTGAHAIHGFTPRAPWRLLDSGADADSAFVTGQFQLSKDAPAAVWPADARITLTYRLAASALRVDVVVDAADGRAMPFGLGFHPYFRPPGAGANDVSTWLLKSQATELWETTANMPSGRRMPIPADLDFRTARTVGATQVDHLYGAMSIPTAGLHEVATLSAPGCSQQLCLWVDDAWRELLLFTPPHRQAVAIEPYTCTTDAANVAAAGTDSGWRVLPAGEVFASQVEYRLQAQ